MCFDIKCTSRSKCLSCPLFVTFFFVTVHSLLPEWSFYSFFFSVRKMQMHCIELQFFFFFKIDDFPRLDEYQQIKRYLHTVIRTCPLARHLKTYLHARTQWRDKSSSRNAWRLWATLSPLIRKSSFKLTGSAICVDIFCYAYHATKHYHWCFKINSRIFVRREDSPPPWNTIGIMPYSLHVTLNVENFFFRLLNKHNCFERPRKKKEKKNTGSLFFKADCITQCLFHCTCDCKTFRSTGP